MTDEALSDYVRENSDLLGRVLACGNAEARAYALAILANSEDLDGVDEVQEQIDRLKRQTG